VHPWLKKRKVCPHDPFINAMPSSRDPCIRGEQEKVATDTRIKQMPVIKTSVYAWRIFFNLDQHF
jgi:hypothetical protein